MYITKNDNHIEIEVAIKTYYPLIFFFGVGAFFTTLFLIVSICYVLFVKDAEVTAEMFGYLFWSPILISITTWLLRGKEIAVLDGTTIRLIRSNGVFKFSKNLKLCSIKNIKTTHMPFFSGIAWVRYLLTTIIKTELSLMVLTLIKYRK